MNNFFKFKDLVLKSKNFTKILIKERHTWKSILNSDVYKQKTIIIGATFLGVGLIGYNINKFRTKNTNSNAFKDEIDLKSIIANTEPGSDTIKTEDSTIHAEIKDDLISKPESFKQEEYSPIIFMNDSNDKVLNGIPTEVPYLIIGGGIAGMSAAKTIRANDPLAKVLIVNEECQSSGQHNEKYPPYRRILLSKYIWRRNEESLKALLDTSGDSKQSSFLFIEPDSFFIEPEKLNQCEFGGISLLNGHRVTQIDPVQSTVTLASNHKISYKACLIATGSSPKRIKHLEISNNTQLDLYNSGKVSYFRSLNDYRNLAEKIKLLRNKENPGRVLIIGGGLLGTELTSSLSRIAKDQGKLEIIEVFREKFNLSRLLPEPLSKYLFENLSKQQTKLISESEVVSINEISDGPDSGQLAVTIKQSMGSENIVENVDHIIIATGVEPETSLSEFARLETDKELGGFLVNAELQSREGIYVAGDACSFYDVFLGRRRVEHWNHSEESGSVAGHNMVARVLKMGTDSKHVVDNSNVAYDVLKPRVYNFQSSFNFTLNLYTSIEAMGLIDSSLETKAYIATDFFDDNLDAAAEERKPEEKERENPRRNHDPLDMPGVVFYLKNKKIVGILLWNCEDDIIVDTDLPSPLRSNVARKILAGHYEINSDDQLVKLASDFDLSFYVNSQVKFLEEYSKKRKEEEAKNAEKDILGT